MQSRLRLSSLGNAGTRAAYLDELRAHLRAREAELSEEVRARIDANPLRAFDSDHPGTRAVMADAPRLLDRLDPDDAEHFADVRALLDEAGLTYDLDPDAGAGPRLLHAHGVRVREPDAWARRAAWGAAGATTAWSSSSAVRRRPAWAGPRASSGSCWPVRSGLAPEPPVYVAIAKSEHRRAAFALARDLRGAGMAAQVEQAGRSMKGQLKHADRLGASAVVIVGDEIEVKDMSTGEQVSVADAREAIAVVAGGAMSG